LSVTTPFWFKAAVDVGDALDSMRGTARRTSAFGPTADVKGRYGRSFVRVVTSSRERSVAGSAGFPSWVIGVAGLLGRLKVDMRRVWIRRLPTAVTDVLVGS
jgi:hypothetical protein